MKVFDSNGTLIRHICGYLQQDLVLHTIGNTATVEFYSDGVIQNVGFLASWLAVPAEEEGGEGTEEGETAEKEKDNRTYLLTFPQAFTKSAESDPENVCLQVLNVDVAGSVDVSVFSAKNILNGSADVKTTFEHSAGDNGIHCTKMHLPADFEAASAVFEVKGSFPESDYSILSYKSVRALTVDPMILVQTDKSEYRPKQVVKLRVLALNYELKPAALGKVHEVWVTNPSNDRLAQWKDVQLKKGMAQMEFALSEEPQLGGGWTVHVKHTPDKEIEKRANFAVAENVLPKFEVKIDAPKTIVRDSDEANFKVCALYTHGGKLRGSLNATFHVSYREGTY